LTQKAAGAADQMSNATVELNQLAQRLGTLVQQFVLDAHSSGTRALPLEGTRAQSPAGPEGGEA
jgi:hypothetical protein